MHESTAKTRNTLLAILLLLGLLFWNMRGIESYQGAEATNIMLQTPDVPPTLALVTFALGPLRGLIVDALWWRMIQQHDSGNFFETMQLTEWITALQPTFAQVWAYHGWNLSYNVAQEFADAETRWAWIMRGLETLRDRGLQFNPGNMVIQDEISHIFLDRMGSTGDRAHEFFKLKWALVMMEYLEDGTRAELAEMVDVMNTGSELYNEPEVRRLVDAARTMEVDLTNPESVLTVQKSRTDTSGNLDSGAHRSAWRRLLLHARAVKLQEKLKLDPRRMLFLDREYGPFEWRQPQAHAVYWAAQEGGTFAEYVQRGYHQSTVIRQAMEQAFRYGGMIYDSGTGFFMNIHNIHIVGRIHDFYDEILEQHEYSATTDRLHKEFLEQAIPILYSFNQIAAAEKLFGHYAEDYLPSDSPMTFEFFMVENMHRIVTSSSYRDNRSIVSACLFQAYFWLAANDAHRSRGYLRMSRLAWERHQQRYAAAPERQLPPFAEMQQAARMAILQSGMAAELKQKLEHAAPELGQALGPEPDPPAEVYVGAHGDQGHGHKKNEK